MQAVNGDKQSRSFTIFTTEHTENIEDYLKKTFLLCALRVLCGHSSFVVKHYMKRSTFYEFIIL